MTLAYLAKHRQFLPTAASWLFDEWGYQVANNSLQKIEQKLSQELNTRSIPLVIIAREKDQLLGLARLCENDLANKPDLSPWLASVLVSKHHRGQDIGKSLVRKAVNIAAKLGVTRLCLKTENKVIFYQALGWSVVEELAFQNRQTTIMKISPVSKE